MSIPVGRVTIKNGASIFWQGNICSMSDGKHTYFDVARAVLGAAKSDPDIKAMLDSGWTDIEYMWEGIRYAIKNAPEGLRVDPIE